MEQERRFLTNAELRVVDGDDGLRIVGYGAVFDAWSEDLGGFRESIQPGAFAKTLQEADIRSLWNHDPSYVLGRNRSGTLSLSADERGLRYEVEPPNAQWALDLMTSIKRGDVDGSSFGFQVVNDEWEEPGIDGVPRRRLLEVKLFDVGPVTFPAYPQTSAEARDKAHDLYTQATEPPEAGHSAGLNGDNASPRARLDVRRRELDLIEQI